MIKNISFENYKGLKRSHDLGRLNLVTGKNGSGKTAIGTAIHIALKGKHPSLGETTQALKKECSADGMTFELIDDAIWIRRVYKFGDKTPHAIWINGTEAKIKEAQTMIDEIYPDSITRLDIGKFTKMNDIDRGIILSDLLGTTKMLAEDVADDIMDLFFRENPESEYVIKYRLAAVPERYDKKAFLTAMRELYADKNPVILEMLDTCQKIMTEKSGLIDLAEHLDAAFEAIKKYRNAKVQEKQYAQKAFAEISTELMDPVEIERGITENRATLAGVNDTLIKVRALYNTLKAIKPLTVLAEVKDQILSLTAELETVSDDAGEDDEEYATANARLIELKRSAQELADYSSWVTAVASEQEALHRLKDSLAMLKGMYVPVTKEKTTVLEAKRAEYLSLKDLLPGECPTCGTVIPEEAAAERKKLKKAAKEAWNEAEKELTARRENGFIDAKIELAKKQIKEAEASLEAKKNLAPKKSDLSSVDLAKEESALKKRLDDISSRKNAARTKSNDLSSALARAEEEVKAHEAYAAKLKENAGMLSVYEADENDPLPALTQAISALVKDQDEATTALQEYLTSQQMSDRLAGDQQRILNLQVAADTLGSVSETIRAYKNDAVQRKIEPVQMLAKKYYHRSDDVIVVTPKTIGVTRNGQYIEQSAMSAGESLSLMSAVLIAIMETSGAKPNYLFIDAAEIDVDNINILLTALEMSNLDCVLVAHHMQIDAPKEWNHIEL